MTAKRLNLLPCPFCGAAGLLGHYEHTRFAVVCTGCVVKTPNMAKKSDAIRRWNRRAA